MNASLQRALADSQASYDRCCKAISASPERLFASGPSGISTTHSSLTNAQEQYQHNRGWVYAAVSAIAKRVAGQRICVGKPKKLCRAKSFYENLEPLDSHPILDLLADPNPLMVGWSLIHSLVSSLLLTGRGHVWLDEKRAAWYLPSHWCEPDDAMKAKWRVRCRGFLADEIPIDGDDMLYVSLPNPEDPFGVMSPLQSQAVAVATDESVQTAQYRSFRNGIFPTMAIKVGGIEPMTGENTKDGGVPPLLDAAQRADLVGAIKRLYGGALNYGEPLILDALISSVERISSTPNEMDFLNSSELVKQRILQAFGVNAIVLGAAIDANRASAVVAEQSFCQSVVNPLAMLISSALTEWLGTRYGGEKLTVWIEPAAADDAEMKIKAFELGLRFGAVSRNDYRRNVLNLEDVPGGDELLLPASMIPESAFNVSFDDAEDTAAEA